MTTDPQDMISAVLAAMSPQEINQLHRAMQQIQRVVAKHPVRGPLALALVAVELDALQKITKHD